MLGILGIYRIVILFLNRSKSDKITELVVITLSIFYSITFLLIDLEVIKASVHLFWGVVVLPIGGILKQIYLFGNGTHDQRADAGKRLISVAVMIAAALLVIGLVALTA